MSDPDIDLNRVVEAEALFGRALPATLNDTSWTVAYKQDSLVLSQRPISEEVSLMCASYELDMSLRDALVMSRPEVYYDRRRPLWDEQMLECGIEQLILPGDAACWFRVPGKEIVKNAMVGSLQAHGPLGSHRSICSGCRQQSRERLRIRYILRRDFPEREQFTIVWAPFCSETGQLLEESLDLKALVVLFEAHPTDQNRCVTKHLRLLKSVPDWTLSHMAPHYLKKQKQIEAYKASAVHCDSSNGESAWVVIGIKKCVRGGPLLPSGCEPVQFDSTWTAVVLGAVGLAGYLREFAAAVGMGAEASPCSIRIYDTLDGTPLVHYQAAMQRSFWERLWAVMEEPWKTQRSVYRKRHGGRSAPELNIDTEPRFIRYSAASCEPLAACNEEQTPQIVVVRTFVHCGGSGMHRGRLRTHSANRVADASSDH